jgi:hypothetical protein
MIDCSVRHHVQIDSAGYQPFTQWAEVLSSAREANHKWFFKGV